MTRRIPAGFSWCLVCDVDGTLAEVSDRRDQMLRHMPDGVDGNETKWDVFWKDADQDTMIMSTWYAVTGVREATKRESKGYMPLIIVTARSERYRGMTETWLKKWKVPYDKVIMRQNADRRPDYVIKREILYELRFEQLEPYMVWDDRDSVVEMWREHGIPCHQVAKGDF